MASSKLVPSNPSDVMVIRDLTPNLTTLSVPFLRAGAIRIGGRATLARLPTGNLAVFSPVALTPEVRTKIDELAGPRGGTVSHIVAPDLEHHIFLSEWKSAFPGAKLIGPAGLPEKRAKTAAQHNPDPRIKDDPFAVVFPLGDEAKKRSVKVDPDFDAAFDYEFVDAHANREIAFFHRPDRTLIQADLLFNLPAHEQYSRVPEDQRSTSRLADRIFTALQTTEGDLTWVRRFHWHVASRRNRPSFNASIRRINQWDFVNIVPCHGETMLGDGKERFRNVFAWHLQDEPK
ncbi:hypothetical protein SODALDRAFT_280056 [Sodiomyces alkalinus F11]|uniref:DUF4336 domain-containing protein n=1 Tax=Sodiomyces alkalinus (strain CBS 110278 / VKM F-3762 / F11) TaxID=1314773 RepID=A0A3N2PTE7_SODAK|nr:hypothetical protein SODALDRAFT_280056 [Sodiomyces alkalinus F11]ROT37586.1 hypothetical protein SODALDRAFT_280056 [Sodiomyces alkalinus F11]